MHASRFLLPLILCGLLSCQSDDDTVTPVQTFPPLAPVLAPVTGNWIHPQPGLSWQWQLSGTINTEHAVDLYDVDLFDTPDSVLAILGDRGVLRVAYFSAGSGEDWREDFASIPASALGQPLDGWPGERWLNIRDPQVFELMRTRIALAASRGFEGVEFDNVDGASNDTGFILDEADQLAYNRMLANEAHSHGLFAVLKNDLDQLEDLVDYYDMALNEECHVWDECDVYEVFRDAGLPVLNAEYADGEVQATALAATICPLSQAAGLNTLILPLDLDDAFRVSCTP
ncbi:MAG: endo alpha-1,4 polygalactosaminidase [Calditrichaeota bacterium]|nr:endo alpha-1,4 polygalactosaminidase [Candidatus Cloacimonadota bacterium]MCB1045916.1 endo alpha-1,4 polygalactosaminidase [Calditrichota bacterium]MCB9472689.1 endo alpha-1,4 polygalactosaminidase [Candidatus Delongbacteria bacterium]